MAFFSLKRWLRSLVNPRTPPIRNRSRYSPRLEQLEDRLAPATFTWTGLGNDANWTTAANWSDATNTAPVGSGSEDLVFPGSGAQKSNFNNLNNSIFNSITFSGGDYTLDGNSTMTVGGTILFSGATGQINLTGVTNDTIRMNLILGGAGSGQQNFTVGPAATLTITGAISNSSGATAGWTKLGTGLMTLSGGNTFTEGFTIAQGPVAITNNGALGTNSTTTVQQNAQLQLLSPGTVDDTLVLSGTGTAANGALLNVTGNNTWRGQVKLAGDTSFGVTAGSLNISGTISDLSSGFNLSKVGLGQLIFSHAGGNTYRGNTTIFSGILTIQDPNALGNTPTHTSTTTVINNINGTGTLQLDNENLARLNGTAPGFVVANEVLVLNGPGVSSGTIINGTIGALNNFKGNNTWTGTVTLGSASGGSNVLIGVQPATNLLISGVIGDPISGGPFSLTKILDGRLILTAHNTYLGETDVGQYVSYNGGVLNLEDSQAAGPSTKTNKVVVNTTLGGNPAALELQLQSDNLLGMIASPKLDSITNTANKLRFSYALDLDTGTGFGGTGVLHSVSGVNTWTGPIRIGAPLGGTTSIGVEPDPNPSASINYFTNDYSLTVTGTISNGFIPPCNLLKLDAGQLILPNANTYVGTTDIRAGWITIQDPDSLGPKGTPSINNLYTTVESGAALHIRPKVTGASFQFNNNLVLAGTGITHPFGLISNAGALESLDGYITLGDILHPSIIQLNGAAGIGVEEIVPSTNPASPFPFFNSVSEMTITGYIWDNGVNSGGIVKLGSRRLILPGVGTYTGDSEIARGVMLVQLDSALGGPNNSKVVVDAALPTIQTLSLTSAVNSFALTFNGFSTAPINYTNTPADAVNIANALNGLAAVTSVGGPNAVTVVQTGVGVFQITFGGGMTTLNESVTATVTSGIGNATVVTQRYGGGAALELGNSLTSQNGGIADGRNIWGKHLVLNGVDPSLFPAAGSGLTGYNGNTNFVDNSLAILIDDSPATAPINDQLFPTDNLWHGPITFAQNANFQIPSKAAVYQVSDAGATGGTFTITVGNNTTGNLAFNATAAAIQSALESLPNVGVGNVLVTSAGSLPVNPMTVTFTGGYASAAVNLSVTSSTLTNPAIATLITQGGAARLVVDGVIDDAANASVNGSDLIVNGGGELDLLGTNTYRGTTFINSGLVTINSSQALGGPGQAPIQTVTIPATVTTFKLTFGGQQTTNISNSGTQAAIAQAIQNALQVLSSVGGPAGSDLGGTVNVTPTAVPGQFQVVFGGSLLGFAQQAMTPATTGGSGVVGIAVVQTGSGGTVVANHATLQLSGSITVSGEPLIVNGQGNVGVNAPTQWFNVGPTTITGGEVAGGGPVSGGRVTGVVSDPRNSNIIYIATAGGGAWKTIDSGNSWRPIFDSIPDIQQVVVPATVTTFTLSFAAPDITGTSVEQTTIGIANVAGNNLATAINIQAALNRLPNIGPVGGFVTVRVTAANTYQITFAGGGLSGYDLAKLFAIRTGGSGNITVSIVQPGRDSRFALYLGAIALDPNAPDTVYIGTGETNNSNDSFYGTGVYKSTDGGITWQIVYGNETEGVYVTDAPTGATSPFGHPDTFTLSFTAPDTTGAIVTQSTNPISSTAAAGTVQTELTNLTNIGGVGGTANVTQTLFQEVQQFIIGDADTNNDSPTWDLTFDGITTSADIAWNASAATLQGQLDTDFGVGTFLVTYWPNQPPPVAPMGQGTYTLYFNTAVYPYQNPLVTLSPPTHGGSAAGLLLGTVKEIQAGGVLYNVTFGGTLGNTPLAGLLTVAGSVISPTETASIRITEPANPFDGKGISQIDASQGNGQLYVASGDGGSGQNEKQELVFSKDGAVGFHELTTPATAPGLNPTFALFFTGADATGALVTDSTGPLTYFFYNGQIGGLTYQQRNIAEIQNALDLLPNILGIGGFVTVTQAAGVQEVQQITINGPTGTFRLRFNGQTTPAGTPLDAASPTLASDIQTQLNALGSIAASGGVVVTTSSPGVFLVTWNNVGNQSQLQVRNANPANIATVTTITQGSTGDRDSYDIEFQGALALTNVSQLTTDKITNPPGPAPWINVSTLIDGGPATVRNGTLTNPGIWRFTTAGGWFNLTNTTSTARASFISLNSNDTIYGTSGTFPGFPYTPGPDDDYRITFPNVGGGFNQFLYADMLPLNAPSGAGVPIIDNTATWTSVQLVTNNFGETILYAALGFSAGNLNNGVFWCADFDTTTPHWYVGNPYDTSAVALSPDIVNTGEFPTGAAGFATLGTVKLSAVAGGTTSYAYFTNNSAGVNLGLPNGRANLGNITIYAVAANPTGTLNNIYFSSDGGYTWVPTVGLPGVGGTTFLGAQGFYANSIVVTSPTTVTVGGTVSNAADQLGQVFRSTSSGGVWTDISVASGSGPHSAQHSLWQDANGRILAGNDGGVWRYDPNSGLWSDLNGNLDIGDTLTVATPATTTGTIFATFQNNGTAAFDNTSQTWKMSDATAAAGGTVGGGPLAIDQQNSNFIYAVQTVLQGNQANAVIRISTNGGLTWKTLPTLSINSATFPLVLDQIDTHRLLIGGGVSSPLYESFDQGASFINLNPALGAGISITGIGLAQYQGIFTADAGFPNVGDAGANTYVPGIIYVTDGKSIHLTKDHGNNWVDRSIPGITVGIVDLVVDPANADHVLVVVNAVKDVVSATKGQIYETTDAGRTWSLIGAGFDATGKPLGLPKVFGDVPHGSGYANIPGLPGELGILAGAPPAVPVWKVVLDPRNGNLYAGTDIGVFVLVGGSTSGNVWQPFGHGMPNVSVRDLSLNPTTNTLIAATYGRGVYEIYLNTAQTIDQASVPPFPVSAPLVAISGASVWSGPITLVGQLGALNQTNSSSNTDFIVTIAADGNQAVQNPIYTASINIIGQISDQTLGANPALIKVGVGNVILSGNNIYGGITNVKQGNLIVDNPSALGGTVNGTYVDAGTALLLESSVNSSPANAEHLFLNGDGPDAGFDGHHTGALESIANINTYFGPITLLTSSTIGVASGSTLTIAGAIDDGGNAFSLTKELVGTLILDDANTYTGPTFVNQGALQIENSAALNSSSATFVLDGAQIQLNGGVTVNEPLSLSGTGINSTGAMLNVGGNNTWAGNITLDANPAFALISYPLGAVSFAVTDPLDTLTITGVISDETNSANLLLKGLSSGLVVLGPGTVALAPTTAGGNTYAGTTYIQSGTLKMQNARALGGAANSNPSPKVQNDIQRLTYYDPSFDGATGSGQFTLSYNGNSTALQTTGVSAATLQAALAALPGIGNGNVAVTRQQLTTPVAGLPRPIFTQFIYTIVFQGALAGVNVSQLVLTTIKGAIGVVSTVADGGIGALVQDGGALALDLAASPNGQIVNGVALQLNGRGPTGNGALENVSGNATWEAPTIGFANNIPPAITLASASAIGVDAGTSLTVRNVPAGDVTGKTGIDGAATAYLSKLGGGTLLLPTVNRYAGTTEVQNGILNVSRATPTASALGQPLSNDIQTLTINGSTNGTFQLTFNGQTTPNIPADYNNGTVTLDTMQAQLTNLSTIGTEPTTGQSNVVVTQLASPRQNTFTIEFVGSLAGQDQNQITATPTPGTTVDIVTTTPGARGYTIVSGGIAVHFQNALGGVSQPRLTADASGLTGTAPGISVATTQIGGGGGDAIQTLYFDGTVTGGSFVLFYNDGTSNTPTNPITWSPVPATLIANIQAALDAVMSVGAGNTAVSGSTYGTLQLKGNTHLTNEQIVLSGPGFGGIGALDSQSGANSIDPSSTVFAPDVIPPSSLIILNGDASIGVDADAGATPGLTVTQAITELVPGSKLDKVGAGSLRLAGTTSNSYGGLTTVDAGTLLLAKTGGAIDIPADLTVGLPGGLVPAVARLQQSDQLLTSANVIVNSAGGLFDVNSNTQTINDLTVTDGTAQSGNTGFLTVLGTTTIFDGNLSTNNAGEIDLGAGGLHMTGGTVNTGASGLVVLNGDVTAVSDAATGATTVLGTGHLSLGGFPRTFTIDAGPAPAGFDMDIQAPLLSLSGEGLTKDGPGFLKLDADNLAGGYTGITTVDDGVLQVAGPNGTIGAALVSGGDLQVDGRAQDIDINGGTLSGTGVGGLGQVNDINGGILGTPPIGTIDPGDNHSATVTGVLTTNPGASTQIWSTGTKLFLDLLDANAGPGAGYDQLVVNGNLDLGGTQIPGGGGTNGGAILDGFVGPGVSIGDTFTIIQVVGAGNTVTGVFNEPFSNNTAFIGGQKFSVTYNAQSVVINRVLNSATLSAVSSANPSVFGQDFLFTATLTPEPGVSAPFDPNDTISFTLRDSLNNVVASGSPSVVNGQATFDANSSGTLLPGSYTLDVAFAGDANYSPTSVTNILTQVINKANTAIALTAVPSNPIFGQTVNVTATVSVTGQGQGIPSGSVTFSIDGGAANAGNGGFDVTANLPAGQNQVTIPLSNLTVGSHVVTATYSGSSNFNTSSTTNPQLAVNVAKDPATVGLSAATSTANPASSSVVNQAVTFTATVANNSGFGNPPSGTVTFFNGASPLGGGNVNFDAPSNSYIAILTTSSLSLGQHTISAMYNGNATLGPATAFLNNLTSNNFTVNQISTTTAIQLTGGNNPSLFGQSVTFTATVAAVAPGSGTPTGTVTFKDNGTAFGTVGLTAIGTASISTSNLSPGTHTITAQYNGATNYATSSNTIQQQVGLTTTTGLIASPNPGVFGSTVTFTATVAPAPGAPNGSPTPTGSVDFLIDGGIGGGGSESGAITLDGTGHAAFPTSSLGLGTHTIVAQYTPTGNTYVGSNSSPLTETIRSATTINLALTNGSNPSAYSQPLTFQATVTATAPGAATPTGTVTLVIDGGPGNGGSQQNATLSGGVASFVISNLPVGLHTLTATYGGDSASTPSSTTSSLNQTVTKANTLPTVTATPSPAPFGTPVAIKVVVAPIGGATATPTGSVTIVVDNGNSATGGFQQTIALTNGQATINANSLTAGSHSIYAIYNNSDGNFNNSTSSTITENVVFATQTAISTSANPSVVGNPLTITATVSFSVGSGTLSGTVDFFDGANNIGTGSVNSTTGQASIQLSNLAFGTHPLKAVYNGNSNFSGSTSATLNESIVSASTTTLALSAGSPTNSVYSQPVSFDVTVAATSAGAPTPTGTVSFFSNGVNVGSKTLTAGQASISLANLNVGTDNVTAVYGGDSMVATSTSNTVVETVTKASTTMSLARTAGSNPSVYGQLVTFTATVNQVAPATATPTGTVTFTVDGNAVATVNLTGNQASYSTSTLPVDVTAHSVQAVYNPTANFTGNSAVLAGGQTVNAFNGQGFNYNPATKTLTVTGTTFIYAQSTTQDAGGTLHSTYFFTMDGVTEAFADTALTSAAVTGVGATDSATLIVNDTYPDHNNIVQETAERVSLGSKADAGVGTLTKFDQGGNPYTFLTLSSFPTSYAYVGRNDGTVNLYGAAGIAYNGFVSAGNYAYMGGPGEFHLVQGAPSVYGYSAGQTTDFAYHYAANAGSAFVASGTAYSYMSATDTVNGVTQSYFNVGVGFILNTGVAKNPGKDFAYFLDSPGNDIFVGGTSYSYMYSTNPDGSFAEFDAAYGFAVVYAQSFVGGTDFADILDGNKNITTGFTIRTGPGRTS